MGHVTHADHFPALHEERIASSDVAGVVVMSLAAVATACCAYQSSVWRGLQARHNHHSETYVLATVLFAVVLFFVGVGPKLPRLPARRLAFWFSAGLLVLTLLWMVTSPIASS